MPSLVHWFSGAALAAFLALVGTLGTLGYAWYRAAVTEQLSSATDAAREKREARRKEIQKKLHEIYLEGHKIAAVKFPKDISEQTFKAYEVIADKWIIESAEWIAANLGHAARSRFLDGSTVPKRDYDTAVNERHNQILQKVITFRQNLAVMLETDAWDTEPTPNENLPR